MKKVRLEDQLFKLLRKNILDKDACDDLILDGADINYITVHGISLITLFSGSGNIRSVQYLLEKGVSLSIERQRVKISAVTLAGIKGHNNIVKLLLSYKPDALKEMDITSLEDFKSELKSEVLGVDFLLNLYKSYSVYNIPAEFMLVACNGYQLEIDSHLRMIGKFFTDYRARNPAVVLSAEEVVDLYLENIVMLSDIHYIKALVSETFERKLRLLKVLTLSYMEPGIQVSRDLELNALVKERYVGALSRYWGNASQWIKSAFMIFCQLDTHMDGRFRLPVEMKHMVLSFLLVSFSKGKLYLRDMESGSLESIHITNEVSFLRCTRGLPKKFETLPLLQSWALGER